MTSKILDGINSPELARFILRDLMNREMSDISEDHYCAGWMIGLERSLWDAVEQYPKPYKYGIGTIDPERIEKLKVISESLGEWCLFEEFVSIEKWRKMLEETDG